jgi:hypothetical protein
MKERVVDRFYDPVVWITSKLTGKPLKRTTQAEDEAAAGGKKKKARGPEKDREKRDDG